MKISRALFLLSALALTFLFSCTQDSDDNVLIQGSVTDEATGAAISGATVQITLPAEYSDIFNRTNSEGNYSLGDFSVSSVTDLTITASATDYITRTRTLKVAPGDNITDFNFELAQEGGDEPGGGDDGGVAGESGGAASIILTGITEDAINIAETGGIVNSAFTFQVQDSAGRALSSSQAVDITFNIVSGPTDATITPQVIRTNSSGSATSNLFSGYTAGVVKIEAEIVREDIGLTIRSKPVAIAIHGGFPDLNHFSISITEANFEGFDTDGVRDQIQVVVGDKFSNPVKPGTAVYFETTGGVIQGSGSGHTDADGVVTVDLISGGDRGLLNHPILGFGYATVTATTVNEDDEEISRQIDVLFSAPPSYDNIQLNPETFAIAANSGENFTLTVTDYNGNPLPVGTTVAIEVADGLEVTGGDIEIPNALIGGPGVTEFEFSVADTDEETSNVQDTNITIKVTTPGGAKASRSFTGTRAKMR